MTTFESALAVSIQYLNHDSEKCYVLLSKNIHLDVNDNIISPYDKKCDSAVLKCVK